MSVDISNFATSLAGQKPKIHKPVLPRSKWLPRWSYVDVDDNGEPTIVEYGRGAGMSWNNPDGNPLEDLMALREEFQNSSRPKFPAIGDSVLINVSHNHAEPWQTIPK